MMANETIPVLANRRQYEKLEEHVDNIIKSHGWETVLQLLKHSRPQGKARDALVALLRLESVGGTDSDIFDEAASLQGEDLRQIRAESVGRIMEILKEQIENKHTYFLDIEAMTMTPYVILVKEVIEARKRELEQLKENPTRIDVLGTFYGFQILMTDGSRPQENTSGTGYYRRWRRTWLDEKISDDAAEAIKSITAELAQGVDLDKTYRTLGGSEIFKKRCTTSTATLLADAVRLSLYKTPGHRGAAARRLGQTGDSRVLVFLHHRLALEQNYKVRTTIAEALGRIGHESSIELLQERINVRGRYMSKESEAMVRGIGGIYSPQSKKTLLDLLKSQGNTTRAVAIQALGGQDSADLIERLTPYLTDRSRPVVRAGVLALAELGDEGKSAIKDRADVIIKRIGYDRPSKAAITKMLSIEGVASMKPLHQYFAKRIQKLEQSFKGYQRRGTVSYSWYWRRRETRARQRFEEFLRFAGSHLKPPFDEDLVKVAEGIARTCDIPTIQELARTIVMKAGWKRRLRDVLFEQSHLSSYV
jgi:hypothetical protein